MFARLIATLSGTSTRTPIRNANRFRPQVEGLEARDVPASLWWTGGGADTDFYTTTNWLPIQTPVAGDDLYYGWLSPSPDTAKDCTNVGLVQVLLGSGGDDEGGDTGSTGAGNGGIRSIHVGNGYDGQITLSASQTLVDFDLLSNARISQPGSGNAPTDITVTGKFNWTDGTLNSSGYDSTLTVLGGTADITPANQGTVTTGDTLVFAAAQAVGGAITGSTGTFNPGTVAFVGGRGIEIHEFCAAEIKPTAQAQVLFSTFNAIDGDGRYLITVGGKCTVVNPGTTPAAATSNMAIVVYGGELVLQSNVTMTFRGNYTATVGGVQIPYGSVTLLDGEVKLPVTSRLVSQQTMSVTGGVLLVLIPNGAVGGEAERRATIEGKLLVAGGQVTFSYGSTVASLQAYLSVTDDILWIGGEYRPVMDQTKNEERSEWRTDGKFTIETAATVRPAQLNSTNPPAANHTWTICHGNGGITGTPALNAVGLTIGTAGNPVNQLHLKKSN